ncbi:NADP-dependent oxidoreductase [Desertivibrio insolitus]|uniref:NADP-dependent oxidoreductase n=1 Tax=Herbiconiux sp. SYSU D00978 TaxID=2812562 RepID=UPI001A9594B8|nr:NADP-dependent oxidoreductase [Herbiconiux sp. SYSU D00978]
MIRAVRVPRFGGPEVLTVERLDPEAPGPGQVRVAVRTAGLNPVDSSIRRGPNAYGFEPPLTNGRELAGVVESVGPDVSRLAPGDEVFGTIPIGAQAELVVADEEQFALKPAALPWEVAGGLALAGQTAWDELASQHVTAADVVLVSAAAGGVGVIAAQLALKLGAIVLGTASERNHEFLRGLGVVPLAYGEGLRERLEQLPRVTVVLDHAGPETLRTALGLGVDPRRINTIATDPAPFGVQRVGRGPRDIRALSTLADLVVDGTLQVPVDSTWAMDDVVDAYRRLEGRHLRGKVVLEIAAR